MLAVLILLFSGIDRSEAITGSRFRGGLGFRRRQRNIKKQKARLDVNFKLVRSDIYTRIGCEERSPSGAPFFFIFFSRSMPGFQAANCVFSILALPREFKRGSSTGTRYLRRSLGNFSEGRVCAAAACLVCVYMDSSIYYAQYGARFSCNEESALDGSAFRTRNGRGR